jgi:hypothetical protein
MDHESGFELLPPGFPSELATAALRRDREAAWPPKQASAVVQWLGNHGYAVLGTELWVLRGTSINSLPIGRSGMGEVHGNTVNREDGEKWISFVARAAKATFAYLQAFKPEDIIEKGEIYFNVVWVDEADFDKLKPA